MVCSLVSPGKLVRVPLAVYEDDRVPCVSLSGGTGNGLFGCKSHYLRSRTSSPESQGEYVTNDSSDELLLQ